MPFLTDPVLPRGTLAQGPLPVIPVGDGLLLRPWTAADAPMVIDAFSDPATRHWHARAIETTEEAEELIAGYAEDWRKEWGAAFALATTDGEALGRVALRAMDLRDGEAEVAYWMRAAARGRGAATSGVLALTRWAFGVGLHRLFLQHSTLNPASCRVAEKAGFPAEGTRRSAVRHDDGWHDMHLHARIASD